MSDMDQFELSRIYAKGWSAGRASGLSLAETTLDTDLEALNPYQTVDERQRWVAGFKDGIRRNEEVGRGWKHQRGTARSAK